MYVYPAVINISIYFSLSVENISPRLSLYPGRDPNKDQSYFLSHVRGCQFHNVIFPLGHQKKETDGNDEKQLLWIVLLWKSGERGVKKYPEGYNCEILDGFRHADAENTFLEIEHDFLSLARLMNLFRQQRNRKNGQSSVLLYQTVKLKLQFRPCIRLMYQFNVQTVLYWINFRL